MTITRTSRVATSTSGLRLVQLKDICDRITKGSTPTSYGFKYTREGIRFIKAENIDKNGLASTTTDYIDHATNEFLKRSILQEHDILFSIAGTIGRVGLIRLTDLPANTNQALAIVRLQAGTVEHKYLFYYLKSDAIQKDALKRIVGVGRANLSLTNIGEFAVPLVPLDQQKQIVAEIEKQFSRLDEAVASLKRVKANLKRYKAAVLKAAVEGNLTEAWRKQHPNVEPASKLVERILAERRAKWNGKGKYKEPTGPSISELPDLPDRWTWITLPQIGELNRGKSKNRPRNDPKLFGGPYPFIQTGDVKHSGGFIRSHSQTYNELGLAQSRLWPAGSLCITIAANIADTGILTYPACFPDSVVGFLFDGDRATVRFTDLFFRTEREQIARFAPATAQKNINLEILSEVAIPFPPLEEQKEIVAEVERRLSVIEELEATVEANLTRADRLKQSILDRAFTGMLT